MLPFVYIGSIAYTGLNMADQVAETPVHLPLSNTEKRVLELHDKLQQLQLEIALLNAQQNYVPGKLASFHALAFLNFFLFHWNKYFHCQTLLTD